MIHNIYTYDVWFEVDDQCAIISRQYDHEADWQEIWDDIVEGGDIQMSFNLISIREE